ARREEAGSVHVEHRADLGQAPRVEIRQEPRELGDVVWPDDEIDLGQRPEEPLALLLRDAPGDPDHEVRAAALELPEPPDLAAELLLRLLADATGVEEHHVRSLDVLGGSVASAAQHLLHPRGVVHVHLTAEGDDREGGHRAREASTEGYESPHQRALTSLGGVDPLRSCPYLRPDPVGARPWRRVGSRRRARGRVLIRWETTIAWPTPSRP